MNHYTIRFHQYLMSNKFEQATLGGGCFWCTEAVFQKIAGVKSVVSGYSGGNVKNPSYQQVVSGNTRHAEVVQVTFDPEVTSYHEILEVFFTMHDPTQLNRQGADIGTQYRSVIFYHTDIQRETAEKFKERMKETNKFNLPIVTEIKPFEAFYEAEKYHKDYYQRNKNQGYSRTVITKKIKKIEEKFREILK